MLSLLIFLLVLYQLQTSTHSEIVEAPPFSPDLLSADEQRLLQEQKLKDGDLARILSKEFSSNGLEDDVITNLIEDGDEVPFVKNGYDRTELGFKYPITSVNIDYSKNTIVLKFRKPYPMKKPLTGEEEEKLKALQDSFMRFGRSPGDFMRFGKRVMESMPRGNNVDNLDFRYKVPKERNERSSDTAGRTARLGMRDSRGDNFMRFGRSPSDFMRLGRVPSADFLRFGRLASGDFMRFGRGGGPNDFMRFGRGGGPNDFMRFGRTPEDFMRFGRSPSDFLRFGRNPSSKDFMRFGRAADEKVTRDASNQNFMRFGRPEEFMRFGKNDKSLENLDSTKTANQTKPSLQRSDVKAAAKLLKQTEPDGDESNPMDKAIKVLFSNEGKSLEEVESNSSNEVMSNERDY